jgi:hypothetical protein
MMAPAIPEAARPEMNPLLTLPYLNHGTRYGEITDNYSAVSACIAIVDQEFVASGAKLVEWEEALPVSKDTHEKSIVEK